MLLRPLFLLLPIVLAATAFGEPVPITPPEMRDALPPQLAVTPAGAVHAVFGMGTAIYHTMSAGGRTFRAPVKIAQLEKLALRMGEQH